MNNRRTFLLRFFVFTAFGVLPLLAMQSRSAFANIRVVDALPLIGSGMWFGGAIASLAAYFRGRRSS
jgi:hypothetical protein